MHNLAGTDPIYSPHAGQGANQCLEDAWTLFETIPAYDPANSISTQEFCEVCRKIAAKRNPVVTAIMQYALKQGEERVIRGAQDADEAQRLRDERLKAKWSDVESVNELFDGMLSSPFDDRGGYERVMHRQK